MVMNLGVLFTAVVTPTNPDESLKPTALARLVENYIQRGVEGIYCGGSTGEGLLFTTDERICAIRTAIEAAAGRCPVIAHVGALRTADSIHMAQAAQQGGATAISMIPPIYYSYTTEEIEAHYRAVLDCTDLPMLLYNIPQFTGIEFDASSSLLADPRVVGIKHTAPSMYALERIKSSFPDKYVINGFDETFVAAMAAGADGTIGTTVGLQPELFVAARSRLKNGDLPGAQLVQSRINEIISGLLKVGVFSGAKYLASRQVPDLGECRKPLRQLSQHDRDFLDTLGDRMDQLIAQTVNEFSGDRRGHLEPC